MRGGVAVRAFRGVVGMGDDDVVGMMSERGVLT
jgi:hypothetical protein